MELILISKCIWSHLSQAIQTRKKIIYIEVRDKNMRSKRHKSKENLNTVVETFERKRNYALFDKFWYLKRGEYYDAQNKSDGFFLDQLDNVCDDQKYAITTGLGKSKQTMRLEDKSSNFSEEDSDYDFDKKQQKRKKSVLNTKVFEAEDEKEQQAANPFFNNLKNMLNDSIN